jgi:hypothetical protein
MRLRKVSSFILQDNFAAKHTGIIAGQVQNNISRNIIQTGVDTLVGVIELYSYRHLCDRGVVCKLEDCVRIVVDVL